MTTRDESSISPGLGPYKNPAPPVTFRGFKDEEMTKAELLWTLRAIAQSMDVIYQHVRQRDA